MKRILFGAILTGAVVLGQAGRVNAQDATASQIESAWTGGNEAPVVWNGNGSYPVVDWIASAPSGSVYNPGASVDGYSYSNWAVYAADPTGGMDLFYNETISSYVPTQGDALSIAGTYSPFDAFPEIENSGAGPLSITLESQGNAPYNPVPIPTTVSTINVGTNSLPGGNGLNQSGLAGSIIELENVTLGNAGSAWGSHQNVTTTVTDATGTMTLFLWASSYSDCAIIATQNGGIAPTGLVNLVGFVDDFSNSAEFVPLAIIVPEPSSIALCSIGGGALLAWVIRRRRSS